MKPRWSTGLVAVVGLLAVVGLAACRGGDRAELPLAGPPVRVDRIDRCTVRVLPATQEEREAFESAVRARLGDLGVERLELGPRGASVRSFVVSGAPVPPAAPANPQQADELATAALARYGAVFGLSPGAVAKIRMRASHAGGHDRGWSATGNVPGASASDVHVHLAESGALRSISFNPALPGPPPGSLCDQPGVALDDPRIRRAVIGQTVDVYQPTRSEPDHVTFVDADIGAIESKIEPVEHDVYRRVITVALQDRMWTAYLDADTAALIRISANFAF